jgi:2-haloacid dehalogenase
MIIDRRAFLAASMGSLLGARAASSGSAVRAGQAQRPIKAILFDAFPLFDPRLVVAIAQSLYPEKAAALITAWRSRQFEYQWLHALGDRYVDFLEATAESLTYAAHQCGLSLTEENRGKLMSAYTALQVWPDTQEILPKLRDLGVSLGILSNMTLGPLESGLTRANLRSLFSHVLSTDSVRSFKPSRRAYQLGIDRLGLDRDEVLFVAFAGWDVAGAVWFGYPTYWLNRLESAAEELAVHPCGTGNDLPSLLSFLEATMLKKQ